MEDACAKVHKPALLSELTREDVPSGNDRLVDFTAFAGEALTVFPPRALLPLSFSDILLVYIHYQRHRAAKL